MKTEHKSWPEDSYYTGIYYYFFFHIWKYCTPSNTKPVYPKKKKSNKQTERAQTFQQAAWCETTMWLNKLQILQKCTWETMFSLYWRHLLPYFENCHKRTNKKDTWYRGVIYDKCASSEVFICLSDLFIRCNRSRNTEDIHEDRAAWRKNEYVVLSLLLWHAGRDAWGPVHLHAHKCYN